MSWRDTTTADAQEALDTLLSTALDLAVQNLQETDSFVPFAVTVNAQQEHALLSGASADANEAIAILERELATQKDGLAAYALAYDTRVAALASDAVEVRLQHREGAAMTIHAPYIKNGKAVEVGELIAQTITRTIW
ncbi:hypothetical protein [Mycobacteroides saopaulense]|uniref:PE domain-containing protein n=1 Tax=Mycobacteroides saopaulense TaxID=1578165 RepID=A0ABX3C5Q3_9MYCO|nr:hypothetical protein [Mycobacteroides saopaulense]OHT89057.1 hypothetical protein BKG68_04195 [Mycobacteroides saopaulense]OHU13878.1 hypothetical protein BKG73_04205 [Mycobacteroides saopaulense]